MAKEGSSGMRPKTIPGHLGPPQPRSKILPSANTSKGKVLTVHMQAVSPVIVT